MSQGRVIFVSRNGAMIVIQHDDGFALVELLGSEGEIELGDEVRGKWDELGGEPIWRDREKFDAYFQGSWGSAGAAIQIAKNTGGG